MSIRQLLRRNMLQVVKSRPGTVNTSKYLTFIVAILLRATSPSVLLSSEIKLIIIIIMNFKHSLYFLLSIKQRPVALDIKGITQNSGSS